jgi:hypothetical protein
MRRFSLPILALPVAALALHEAPDHRSNGLYVAQLYLLPDGHREVPESPASAVTSPPLMTTTLSMLTIMIGESAKRMLLPKIS